MNTDYNGQAQMFCQAYGVIITIKKASKQTAPLWEDQHGIKYRVNIKRGRKTYSFNFWDSVANMEKGEKPTVYDVLACLTKYDPNTLDDFINEFGITKNIEKTYKAVKNEWLNVKRIFSDCLEQLTEIQ